MKITDVQVKMTNDNAIHRLTVSTDQMIGTNDDGTDMYFSTILLWNRNTGPEIIMKKVLASFEAYDAVIAIEKQKSQALLKKLKEL